MVTGDQMRQMFLDYFQARGHLIMPSASLIPAGDPTLLLTSAGMVPFKPYFLGQASPPSRRMTSSQKCFRYTDIDTVGDYKHLTFFEMLGNFSVGEYFKEGAIPFAWEFVTKHMGLPPERLWVTIYLDDDEAFRLWHEGVGVPADRIYRYGKSDNWWGPAGLEGPCGPCSEIHYDFGPELGCGALARPDEAHKYVERDVGCHPNCDRCERFVELWNLVFMQFYQDLDKKLTPLPAPNIDTGLGLERAITILQGKKTIYDTDLFQPILARITALVGKPYGSDRESDFAMRVVAEHGRGAAFLIADGVVPGNDGRGYVLRRIIRRAVRFGRKLGLSRLVGMGQVATVVMERMGHVYPELLTNREFILRVLELEEERFGATLNDGLQTLAGYVRCLHRVSDPLLKDADKTIRSAVAATGKVPELWRLGINLAIGRIEDALDKGYKASLLTQKRHQGFWLARTLLKQKLAKVREEGGLVARTLADGKVVTPDIDRDQLLSAWDSFAKACRQISGQEVFRLHDTYGFPSELTAEIASEHGLKVDVDMEGFKKEMEDQRKRSRATAQFSGGPLEKTVRYEALGVGATRFVGYERLAERSVVVGLIVDGQVASRAEAGQEVEVVLRETPFYPEGGGQVGDAGEIVGPSGKMAVADTHSPISGLIVHRAKVAEGTIALGDSVEARVDAEWRLDTARNHTGTHMLHAALRQVLGTHVRQAGSLVAPDRLRFDFTHVQALSREELLAVERIVNEQIRRDLPVRKRESTYTEAVREGALAFFGERYGETVRVVEVGEADRFSAEVCGGTHLERTGQIGLCLVTGESSIGSGVRRIEAVTGRGAEALVRERLTALEELAQTLGTTPADLPGRVSSLLEELEQARKQMEALERQSARRDAERLLGQVQKVDGVQVLTARLTATSIEALREVGDYLRDKLGSGVLVLGAVLDQRPTLIAMVTPDLTKQGLSAATIVREAARVMDGGGGGRPEMAQAGGKRADKLDEALRLVPGLVRKR